MSNKKHLYMTTILTYSDRERQRVFRFPKRRVAEKKVVDVEVRSPSTYDQFIPGGVL